MTTDAIQKATDQYGLYPWLIQRPGRECVTRVLNRKESMVLVLTQNIYIVHLYSDFTVTVYLFACWVIIHAFVVICQGKQTFMV